MVLKTEKCIILPATLEAEPCKQNTYGFSGQILPVSKPPIYKTERVTYTDLRYIQKVDGYYCFELPMNHPGHESFKGYSGAPILSDKGELVALVCGGDINKNLIYGISLIKYKLVIDLEYGFLSEYK